MHALVVAGSAVLGVLVGAVCNVLIDRVPDKVAAARAARGRGRPPRSRGSACPRSRGSSAPAARPTAPLPSRWLWVEVVTVAAFAELAVQYGDTWVLAPLLLLAACLITVSVIDLQVQRIPDRITFPTFALSVPAIVAVSVHLRRHRHDPGRVHRRRRLLPLPVRDPPDLPGRAWASAT